MAAVNVQDRRIEQYLSNFAVSYKQGERVADFIAPPFKVKKSSDKYLEWTKNNFRILDNKIKGREEGKEIDLKVDEGSYSCEEYETDAFISDRDIRNSEGVGTLRLKEDTIARMMDSHLDSREKRVADIAFSNSIVTQTSDKSAAWATVASGTPVADIITAAVTINDAAGVRPNAIVMGFNVAMAIIKTTEWKDYFRYDNSMGNKQAIWNAVEGLRNLGLQPMISGVRGLSTYEGTASDPTWETLISDSVLIFYRENVPTTRSMTFMSSPYTMMNKVESWRIPGQRGTKYSVYEEVDELLINASCAYLYTNVI